MVDKNKKRVQKDKKRREALRKAKTVVRMSPQELEFESKRAYQALRDNAPLRAEKIARKALRAKPDHPQLLATLTTALDQLDRIEEAVLTAKRLVEVQPGNPDAHDILGATYKFNGRLDDAAASFLRATELNPQHAAAWRNFASVHRFDDPGAAVLTAMREALDRAPARGPARISLEFALGKALSDLGQVDESFKFYHQANYHKRIGIPFSSDAQSRSIDSLIGSIGEEFLGHGPAPAASKDAPILVVGMPRSGSTLVEQILASHPSVVGVGEVSDLFDTLAPVSKDSERYPEAIAALSPEAIARYGNTYADKLRSRQPNAERIVDKFLFNYPHLGFLARALPNAKFINCLRDPMDTCFSTYKIEFTASILFGYDLKDLGAVYQLYRRVINHWHEVMPGRVLDVQYEDLVSDQEGQTRRLLEHCDLEWDDAVMRFHETRRRVTSASAAQVREPMYKGSVGKWRPYAAHLGELRDALGPYAPEA